MNRNKTTLVSAILFTTYDLYIIIRTIYYLCNYNTYGNVYFDFLFYPHLACVLIATILNYVLYFKNNKYTKIFMIVFYLIAIALLFIKI